MATTFKDKILSTGGFFDVIRVEGAPIKGASNARGEDEKRLPWYYSMRKGEGSISVHAFVYIEGIDGPTPEGLWPLVIDERDGLSNTDPALTMTARQWIETIRDYAPAQIEAIKEETAEAFFIPLPQPTPEQIIS